MCVDSSADVGLSKALSLVMATEISLNEVYTPPNLPL